MKRLLVVLGLALTALTAPAAAAAPATAAPPRNLVDAEPAAADRQALERALAVDGLERSPTPPEASYGRDLGMAIQRAVAGFFARGNLLRAPRQLLLGTVVLAGAAALLALLFKILLPWWRGRRDRGQKEEGAGDTVPSTLPAAAAARDAAAWRAELDRCLAEGRVADGLQAAWWWLARSLAGERAEPTWTGRDLLAHLRRDDRRHDLRELVRRLDVLLYGPARPGLDDLRRLVGRMEETLA